MVLKEGEKVFFLWKVHVLNVNIQIVNALKANKITMGCINAKKSNRFVIGTDTTWFQPLSLNGGTIQTRYADASVRVKMWRQNDMPPDYDTDFKYLLRSKNNISRKYLL